ncbi:MAG: HEPN domain-containing protein [Actinomycetota bacterium]|nr:HEPN domain-containing protein [Actinomycetota bacterium]
MLDEAEYERWRHAGADALAAARVQAEAGFHHWTCFLAEQSAQLVVKGLLHGIGAGAWGHDLVELGVAWSQALGEVVRTDVAAALQRLSRHYIPARYPDAHPSGSPGAHYGPTDSAQALADAVLVAAEVGSAWEELVAEASG